MAFKFTDAVFRITNNGNYCFFCNEVFKGGTIEKRKRKGEMRDKKLSAEEELLKHSKSHPFGHVEKAVLLALADHANDDGICWPGYTLLSRETYLSPASISAAIKNLKMLKLIAIAEKPTRRSAAYKLTMETDSAVTEATRRKALNDAGIELPAKTIRKGGKTAYSRKPKEESSVSNEEGDFYDEPDTTNGFNIEGDDNYA